MGRQLGEFEQLLLFAVLELEEEAFGGAIRARIRDRTGREVSPGAVYTALDRLEAKGLVRSRLGEGTPARGGRRKRFFRLQPEGAAVLLEAYRTMERMSDGLLPRLVDVAESLGGEV